MVISEILSDGIQDFSYVWVCIYINGGHQMLYILACKSVSPFHSIVKALRSSWRWIPFAASGYKLLLCTYLKFWQWLLITHKYSCSLQGCSLCRMARASYMNQTCYVEMGLLARLGQSSQFYWSFIEGLLHMKLTAFEYCQLCSIFCRTIDDCFFSLQLHRVPPMSLTSQQLILLH